MAIVAAPTRPVPPQIRQTQLFMNGQWIPARSGRTFATVNPATEEVIAQVAEADAADVEAAVRAARDAFDHGPWSRMDARERGRLMLRLCDLIEAEIDELAALESLDNGKPVKDARTIDIDSFVDPKTVRFAWMSRPFVALTPQEGFSPTQATRLLKRHERFECWLKENIPARLRFGSHPRVPPVLCLADNGWSFVSSSRPERYPLTGGAHGYDPAHPDMDGLFVASGPSFRRGARVPAFDNVDVHPLMMHLLGLKPLESQRALGSVRSALRPAN